jgi:hypothetical protein
MKEILMLCLLLIVVSIFTYRIGLYIGTVAGKFIGDIWACCFYQCVGFGFVNNKKTPIFRVKQNVVYVGKTFISHQKAKRVARV